ncbi:hypothetical protein BX265_5056 [Streptomyces sp. TLI_235]|nr:hypothetical protein [Streptomyces sp. TLI_235]PBC70516.1 hypothetical protein BX265_5056 [Streptomyces sp. TLI_235]
MDEQTGAEQAHAALRETVIEARPQEAELRATESWAAAEPAARLEPMHAAEPLTRLEPMHAAEPLTRLEPMHAAEPLTRLEPMHAAEPLTRLEPLQRRDAAEPTELLRPTAMEATPAMSDRLRPTAMEAVPAEPALTRSTPLAAATAREAVPASEAQVKRLAPTTGAATQSGGGSAGSGFEVNPDQYRAAVSPVLAAADQLSQLVTGLSAFLDHTQSTAPWGNDESGKKFAEGEKGYLKYSTETLKGLKGMPDAVRYVADGLKAMAENYRAAEEGNSSAFQDGGGAEGVSVSQPGSYSAPVNVTSPGATLRGIAQAHPSTTRRA